MSSYLESKYLNLLSPQLQLFKRKNDAVYNFRCPYCLDSQTNLNKARGYVFIKENSLIFKCHNCGHGASISNLLKHVNPTLHKEYLKTPLGKLKKVSQLAIGHKARNYILGRQIPTNYHYKLFYAPKFYEFVNLCDPGKFPNIKFDEPRIIIPFIDKEENLIGFQGRALGKSNLKYITIMLESDSPKI